MVGIFLQRKLVPLVEQETANYLHRPLELGKTKICFPKSSQLWQQRATSY